MTDTWHTELEQDGIWHSGGRNYRSRTAALKAADWHKSWPERPSIADELAAICL